MIPPMFNVTDLMNVTTSPYLSASPLVTTDNCRQWCLHQHLFASYQPLYPISLALLCLGIAFGIEFVQQRKPEWIAQSSYNWNYISNKTRNTAFYLLFFGVLWTCYIMLYGYS